jgi:hypothetical protein
MAGNRNDGADRRRSASRTEKARVLLHLWMVAALLTLIVKVALH